MSLLLEIKKLKRTGFFPAFLIGAILAASFPIINIAVRPENFINQNLPALDILMNANWQMISMLNMFFLVIGSCIIYHTEFADHAMQKMEALPQPIGKLFINKTLILIGSIIFALIIEAASFIFCAYYWFNTDNSFLPDILKYFGYEFILLIPAALLIMIIASLCQNMWISLGIGVIGVFIATMLPTDNLILSFFPFAMPFQTLNNAIDNSWISPFLISSGIQTILFSIIEVCILKVRRNIA